MVEYYSVSSYNDFVHELVRLTKAHNRVLTLFCGELDGNGQSWCSDCRNAIPVIQNVIESGAIQNVALAYIFVGIPRDEWKNPDNSYRSDQKLRLTNVPTLICWEQGKEVSRLVETECAAVELVAPFFKDKHVRR